MNTKYKQVEEQLAQEEAHLESVRQMQALHMREILALKDMERTLVLSINANKHFLGKHGGDE